MQSTTNASCMKTGLDQYTDIIIYAVKNSAAKLTRFWSGCAQAVKHGLGIMGTWP